MYFPASQDVHDVTVPAVEYLPAKHAVILVAPEDTMRLNTALQVVSVGHL
jgi:hypothetical protein